MSLIKWTAEFDTGHPEVDAQHRHLVDIINRFHDALQRGNGSRIMNGILNDLIGYTQEHFADEERIMAAAGYTGLQTHQAQHRQLLQKIERFQYDFNSKGKRVSKDVDQFLKYWLTNHILQDDLSFAAIRDEAAAEEPAPA